jgi:serine/threonine protein phosphatase PrpC
MRWFTDRDRPAVDAMAAKAPTSSASAITNKPLTQDPVPVPDRDLELLDHPSQAPTVGEVSDTFCSRLDGHNPNRLPTLCADAGALGPLWLAGASLAGPAHLHKATTGQDSYSFALSRDRKAVILAVADGLGSQPTSAQLGSMLLTRLLCAVLADQATDTVVEAPAKVVAEAVSLANSRLQDLRGCAFPQFQDRNLSAALTFAWVPIEHQDRSAVMGRVGDCAAFTVCGGEYSAVFKQDDGPLNAVEGTLPSDRPEEALEVELLDLAGSEYLVLGTDGLANDIFSSPGVRDWLSRRWSRPVTAFHMLESLRYRRQGSQDDRTGVVLWLAPIYPPCEPGLSHFTAETGQEGARPSVEDLKVPAKEKTAP